MYTGHPEYAQYVCILISNRYSIYIYRSFTQRDKYVYTGQYIEIPHIDTSRAVQCDVIMRSIYVISY